MKQYYAITPECIDRLSIGSWDTLIESGKQLCKLLITCRPEILFNSYQKFVCKTGIIAFNRMVVGTSDLPKLPPELVILVASYVSSSKFYGQPRELSSREINSITEEKRALAI